MKRFFSMLAIATSMLCLGLLAGCSALQLSYNQSDVWLRWEVDDYLDLSSSQQAALKAALARQQAWHRSAELPEFERLMAHAQSLLQAAPGRLRRADLQGLYDALRQRLRAAVDHGLADAAELIPTLDGAQIEHLARQYAKSNDKFRKDFMRGSDAEQRRKACDKFLDRLEWLYGDFERAQRQDFERLCLTRPHNPAIQLADRQRRQQEMLALLRRVQAERPQKAQLIEWLRAYANGFEIAPNPEHAAFKRARLDADLELLTHIANHVTEAQRTHGVRRLQGWIDDVEALRASARR